MFRRPHNLVGQLLLHEVRNDGSMGQRGPFAHNPIEVSPMEPWYQIEIDDSWLPAGRLHQLCRQFQRAYIHAGAPADMALFAVRGTSDASRCLYLSPHAPRHAASLLDEYAARPCGCPSREQLTLLYGRPDAEEMLFDGYELMS